MPPLSVRIRSQILIVLIALIFNCQIGAQEQPNAASAKLILAHYMPWFEGKPVSPKWGWHWTMGRYDPEKKIDQRSELASHYYPWIGPYDSSDRDVIEYQLLTMKLAGIDGVIVDWYGLTNFRDYAILHRNTTRLLESAERLKMKFAICYEDQTIPALVEAKRIQKENRTSHAANEIQWLSKYWFQSPSYVQVDGKPLLLSFGQTGLSDAEWSDCLAQAKTPVTYISQHHRRTAAVGAFDWPVPSDSANALKRFQKDSKNWKQSIPVAFPRFVDFYAEANVGKSYGRIEDDQGKSFREMLKHCLQSNASVIQLATWNDWGEGTQIEPSIEFGYRDLETVQALRRQTFDPQFASQPDDLLLPLLLLQCRRIANADMNRLDRVVQAIVDGKLSQARDSLSEIQE